MDTTLIQKLPSVPNTLFMSQCVWVPNHNELLICGGLNNRECYSYHIQKQAYQIICKYPKNIELEGHVVIPYFFNSLVIKNTIDTFTVLSFGGDPGIYHTLMMKYKSVWDPSNINFKNKINTKLEKKDNNDNNDNNIFHSKDQIFNEWIPLPNNLIIGKEENWDIGGSRVLIGGYHENLLFISHAAKKIDIIDLQSFESLKHLKYNNLPYSNEDEAIKFHCFVPMNKKSKNEFILMACGITWQIQYNEMNKEFSYQKLCVTSSIKNLFGFGFTYSHHYIFIFGGCELSDQERGLDCIWKYDKKKKIWEKCNLNFPSTLLVPTVIKSEDDESIHIIGGPDTDSPVIDHWVIYMWTLKKIGKIMRYWFRENTLKIGWIVEFNNIIQNYLNL